MHVHSAMHTVPYDQREITLTQGQLQAMQQLRLFLHTPGNGIFILKGYAGAGKTTLLQQLAKELKQQQKNFVLLAPTGRAAAVLRAKTGLEAYTIHSQLYFFTDVDGEPDDDIEEPDVDDFGQMRLVFSMRELTEDEPPKIYIVDEASMISDSPAADTSYAQFGSGHLLSDLLYVAGSNKIIFAGDPCQLPPVGAQESPALSTTYLRKFGKYVQEFELTEILRQKHDSPVLKLAWRLRQLAERPQLPQWVKIPCMDVEAVKKCSYHQQQEAYLDTVTTYGADDIIAICNSHQECNKINRLVRQRLYGDAFARLQPGDLLMVTQNNYNVPLVNGDFVTVTHIGSEEYHLGIKFCRITVKAHHSGISYETLLCMDPLFNGRRNLTPDQQRMLMIDFSNRMRKKGIKRKSDEYRRALGNDKYLNSLRANFGYAITCHKSQGGEWEKVFLFLHKGMYSMPRPTLTRWWYTAVTRAKCHLTLTQDWWLS